MNTPVRVVGTPEAAAHGAALLAATGSGAFTSVHEATEAAVTVGHVIAPSGLSDRYDDAYRIYRSLYPSLRSASTDLGALDA